MACHVEDWGPPFGQVIWCGETPPKEPCAHCGCRDAKALCDWPVIKPVSFDPFDAVVVGDVLVQLSGWRARIVDIKRVCTPGYEQILVSASVLDAATGSRPRVLPFETSFSIAPGNYQKFRVEGRGTCDKPCCFRCRRHVAENVDYCRDHWSEGARADAVQRGLFE